MSLSIPFDLAHRGNMLFGSGGAQVPKRCIKIGIAGIRHHGARVDLVPEPSCDAGAAEFVQLEIVAAAFSSEPFDAVRAVAACNLGAASHALDHPQ